MKDIVAVGEVLIDLTQKGTDELGVGQYAANPGGAPANLAVAAARLGAKGVVAVDIDPDAVRVARENVAHNGLEDAIEVRQGDLLQGLSQQFDFAAANILAPVICMLAAPLKAHLKPHGRFICSGIIAEAEAEVNEALLAAGYQIDEIVHKGDWVAFATHI